MEIHVTVLSKSKTFLAINAHTTYTFAFNTFQGQQVSTLGKDVTEICVEFVSRYIMFNKLLVTNNHLHFNFNRYAHECKTDIYMHILQF